MANRWYGWRVTLWLVLGWASILPNPVWAENQDSSSVSVQFPEADYKAGIQEEFSAKLTEMRSIPKRKDALVAVYGELARLLTNFKDHIDKLDAQISTVESKGASATLSDRQHILLLRAMARQRQQHLNYTRIHMDSLLAEYEVLSRMAELERSYTAKEITKADFTTESRSLREELSQVTAERRMNSLGEEIMDGFAHIENQMMSMAQSLRSNSMR